jgi:hypothetical protein
MMLESRANRELCRNGDLLAPRISPIQLSNSANKRTPEQEKIAVFVKSKDPYCYPCNGKMRVFLMTSVGVLERESQQLAPIVEYPVWPPDYPPSGAASQLLVESDRIIAGIDQTLGPPPIVTRIDQLEQDRDTRERHQQWLEPLIGSIATTQVVEAPEKSQPKEISLASAIHNVRNGDETLLPLIEANVATATGENLEKVEYVIDIELEETPEGEIIQFGQTLSQVHKNTILSYDWQEPVMDERTRIESLSAFRTEDAHNAGLTNDHWLIDITLIPDLPDDKLEELHFFPRTKTGIIRGVTRREDGKLIIRSAFFAGVTEEGVPRHDLEAVRALMVEDWGIAEAAEWNINDCLQNLVAIPKAVLPNGPVDIMPKLDDKIHRLTGQETYWGQNGPKGDYISVIQESKDRDEGRSKLKQRITRDLIHAPDSYSHPIDAIEALQNLVEKHGALEVIEDMFYPSWILGEKAKVDIEEARRCHTEMRAMIRAGEMAQAQQLFYKSTLATRRAQENAKGGSCPYKDRQRGLFQGDIWELDIDQFGLETTAEEIDPDEDALGSLTFDCPKCGFTNHRPRGETIPKCQNPKKCNAVVACKGNDD